MLFQVAARLANLWNTISGASTSRLETKRYSDSGSTIFSVTRGLVVFILVHLKA
jgi:hypothetical protein